MGLPLSPLAWVHTAACVQPFQIVHLPPAYNPYIRNFDDLEGSFVAALGKLLPTTAFQLTLVYLVVFALFAAFLLGYFAFNTRRLIDEQITTIVNDEIQLLQGQYNPAGLRRLAAAVEVRSRRPGSSLYLVTTPIGEGLAGN